VPNRPPNGWKGATVLDRLLAHVHSTSPSSPTDHTATATLRQRMGSNPTLNGSPDRTTDRLPNPTSPLPRLQRACER
jgi:hypothetical protein